MDYHSRIITDIELHNVAGIRECFENGVSPNDSYKGEPLLFELTSEYMRSPAFKECVKAFVDFGLKFNDRILLAVLLDDEEMLRNELASKPDAASRRYTMRCAFTPLLNVTLLHICAEFNHVSCAKLLVEFGLDANTTAGIDELGFGGQTPIFHTVNQLMSASADMFQFLLAQSADLEITVRGLVWGKGYEWETFIPSVNPLSYAMMGLLPQMHRQQDEIARTVAVLLEKRYGILYTLPNVPNRYLTR